MSGPKFIKSATYSDQLDDDLYCVINRSLVHREHYGTELIKLKNAHDRINEHVIWLSPMLN